MFLNTEKIGPKHGTAEMAPGTLANKPDNLSSTPTPTWWDAKTDSLNLSTYLHTSHSMRTPPTIRK